MHNRRATASCAFFRSGPPACRFGLLLLALAALPLLCPGLARGQSSFDAEAFASYKRQMSDADRDKRLLAAHKLLEVLSAGGTDEALREEVRSFLSASLRGGDKPALLSLLKAVGLKNSRAFTTEILDLLHVEDEDIRSGALDTLGHVRDPRVQEALAGRFTDAKRPTRMRLEAIEAVVALDLWPVQSLIAMLEDTSRPVRNASQRALVTLTGYAWGRDHDSWSRWWSENGTRSKSAILRDAIARLKEAFREHFLGQLDPEDLSQNLSALRENRDEAIRLAALRNLELLGRPEAVETLVWLLEEDSRTTVSVRTIEVLGNLVRKEDSEAGRALVRQLGAVNGNVEIKAAVVRAMGKIREITGVDFLPPIGALLSDADPRLRSLAAEAAGRIGRNDDTLVAKLLALLKDEGDDVRRASAKALGEMKARGAVDGLAATLDDTDPNVRWCAASSLGLIGDAKARAPLLRRLTVEKEPRILEVVISSLVQLRAHEAVEGLVAVAARDPKARLARTALQALWTVCRDSVEALLDAAKRLEEAGLAAESADTFEKLLAAHPEKSRPLREKAAESMEKAGRHERAFALRMAVLSEQKTPDRALAGKALASAAASGAGAAKALLSAARTLPGLAAEAWSALLGLRGARKEEKDRKALDAAVRKELAALPAAERVRLLEALTGLVHPSRKSEGLAAHALLGELLPGPPIRLGADAPEAAWAQARKAWSGRASAPKRNSDESSEEGG